MEEISKIQFLAAKVGQTSSSLAANLIKCIERLSGFLYFMCRTLWPLKTENGLKGGKHALQITTTNTA
jgi:hypothetical protein